MKIGVLESTTGALGPYGSAYVEGQKVAIQMVNDAGGIKSLGGAKIVMVEGKGDSTPATATAEVERLINSEKVVAISGPTSTAEILAAIPMFERYKVPQVGGLADETQYQKGYRFVFGTTMGGRSIGRQQAEFVDWLAKNYGLPTERIAIATLTPALTPRHEGLTARLAELGHKNIVLNETFPATVTDQSPLVLKLKAANPTLVIYLGVGADGIAFHKACATYDYYPWMVVDDNGYGGVIVRDGLPADTAKKTLIRPNVFGVGNGIAGDVYTRVPSLKTFKELWEKAYPGSKSHYPTVAQGAQRLLVLIRAIENAASRNPEAIADALRKVDIQAPDTYLVFGDAYPRNKMSESGLIATATIMAEQWADDLSGPQIIWPDSLANAKPRVKK